MSASTAGRCAPTSWWSVTISRMPRGRPAAASTEFVPQSQVMTSLAPRACRSLSAVVTVEGDPFPGGDRLRDEIAGDRHIFEQEGVRGSLEVGLQPGLELTLADDAATMQDLPEHRGEGLQSWLSPKWLGEFPVPAFLLQGRPQYGTGLRQLRVEVIHSARGDAWGTQWVGRHSSRTRRADSTSPRRTTRIRIIGRSRPIARRSAWARVSPGWPVAATRAMNSGVGASPVASIRSSSSPKPIRSKWRR